MGTMVEDLVRLAWQSEVEGKPGTRDALLTLAVAESGVEDLVLAEKARRVLVMRRPDHWFASPVPMSQWMDNPEVINVLGKLRTMFPRVRVRHLLMRGDAQRGPYSGRVASPSQLLLDLVPAPTPPKPHIKAIAPVAKLPEASATPQEEMLAFYWSILLAMAVTMKIALDSASVDEKAIPARR